MKQIKGFLLLGCCYALALSGTVQAQTVGGTILGRMMDPSGAAVPNGKVVIQNQETNVSREVVTNTSGLYVVPDLAPGSYNVRATATGFETVVVSGVRLNVGAELTLNLPMK